MTGISILVAPAPQASNNVMLALPKFENVLPLFRETKRQLSEILSAFEFMDRTVYDLAVKHGQGRALNPEDVEGANCFVLVETSGGKREHDEEVCIAAKSLPERTYVDPDPTFPETQHLVRISHGSGGAVDQHRRDRDLPCAFLLSLGY